MAKDGGMEGVSPMHIPPVLAHSHPNAFHVWDQDDVIIPMAHLHESPLASPLMSVMPYIPSFFPASLNVNSPSYNYPLPRESDAWDSVRDPRQFSCGASVFNTVSSYPPLALIPFFSWAPLAPCFHPWNTFQTPCWIKLNHLWEHRVKINLWHKASIILWLAETWRLCMQDFWHFLTRIILKQWLRPIRTCGFTAVGVTDLCHWPFLRIRAWDSEWDSLHLLIFPPDLCQVSIIIIYPLLLDSVISPHCYISFYVGT